MELKGCTAIVTGGSGGLGHRICIALAKNGVNVVVNYAESESKAKGVADELKQLGVRAIAVRADVADPAAVARMVEQTAIVKEAREESKRILADAREQSETERDEVDNYIDSRLATLEVILNKTMDAVVRGRERLAGAGDKDVLSQLADND